MSKLYDENGVSFEFKDDDAVNGVFIEFTKDDAVKMHDCLKAMAGGLAKAQTGIAEYNRAKAEYEAIKERYSSEEDQIDDLVGAVYAGIVGKKNV